MRFAPFEESDSTIGPTSVLVGQARISRLFPRHTMASLGPGVCFGFVPHGRHTAQATSTEEPRSLYYVCVPTDEPFSGNELPLEGWVVTLVVLCVHVHHTPARNHLLMFIQRGPCCTSSCP